jgi:type III secretion protein U
MAESNPGGAQPKTEEPTPKRLRDARQRGDVWQSTDLSATVVLIVFTLLAVAGVRPALAALTQALGDAVVAATRPETDVLQRVRQLMVWLGIGSVIAAAVMTAVAALVSAIQVGGAFSATKLAPDLGKLDPIEGLKRMFSLRTLFELLRLLVKLLAIGLMLWVLARSQLPLLAQAERIPLLSWLLIGGQHIEALLMLSCLVFGAVALADVAYQRWDYRRRHRMTKEEVRREYKEREGDPILRGRRRQLHQELAFNDMLSRVRTASVVVVNPTHVAVALHYDPQETPIPMVVAKGEGEVARAIRQAAEEAGVPVYRDVSLARALQGQTPINDYIPDDLIEPVAHVLRWVERMKPRPIDSPGDSPLPLP